MTEIPPPDPYTPLDAVFNTRFTQPGPDAFKKIYCDCGRIVDVDLGGYLVKASLHKRIECAHCRNVRIAAEIDSLDENHGPADEWSALDDSFPGAACRGGPGPFRELDGLLLNLESVILRRFLYNLFRFRLIPGRGGGPSGGAVR